MHYNKWNDNTSGVAKVIVLPELVTIFERKGRHAQGGEIKIGFNDSKDYRKIVNKIRKVSNYAQEVGSEIAMIENLIKKLNLK